jgi:hypothetical protein
VNIKTIALLSTIILSAIYSPASSQENSNTSQKISVGDTSKIAIMPWSKVKPTTSKRFETVYIKDKSGLQYIATLDKISQSQSDNVSEKGAIGYWYADKVRMYTYSITNDVAHTKAISKITITIGKNAYRLQGKNSYYSITPELACAIRTDTSGDGKIKIEFTDDSPFIAAEISNDTLTTLKALYQRSKAPSEDEVLDRSNLDSIDRHNL